MSESRSQPLPREPTHDMLEAMVRALFDMDHSDLKWKDAMQMARKAYRVARDAAPQAVAQSVRAPGKLAEAEDTGGRGFESRQPVGAASLQSERTESKWIACSERMPQGDVFVLTAHRRGMSVKPAAVVRHTMADVSEYGFYTHWMPLPEAPK